jgi:hypothetical protein
MEYYIYVYLDVRSQGDYTYGEYKFDYEPFYVGKGKGLRYKKHLSVVKSGNYKNFAKYHIIKKILDEGKEPIILKYFKNLTEEDAFKFEMDMIKKIGRFDMGNGPLRNLSEGGEGPSGSKRSEETRKKISVSKKGVCTENMMNHLKNNHSKMKGNQRTLGFKFSEESKKRMGESHNKSILQIDDSGNVINEFSSIKEAEIFTGCNIKKVLLGEGKTGGGYMWRYKDEEEDKRRVSKYIKNQEKKILKKINTISGKSVYKKGINGCILEKYNSITEASLSNNITVGNISKVLTGKGKTAGGYSWEYCT